MSLLTVKNLSVHFRVGEHLAPAATNVSFELKPQQTLAIVGESGSGKSVTANSILRLLPAESAVIDPDSCVEFDGRRLDSMSLDGLRQVRGRQIGMIFQEPMISLNPLQSVRRQVGEPLRIHKKLRGRALDTAVLELLDMVQLGDASRLWKAYPFELSGGQRQRVMIAMALANRPKLLIADEPTTALDATIQADIIKLLKQLQRDLGMAMLFITHDLPVVKAIADQVLVMERGQVVERGETTALFGAPKHPYTQRLLAAEPTGTRKALWGGRNDTTRVIDVQNLNVAYPIRKGIFKRVVSHVHAVNDVSFDIHVGETIGVLGESGSGKSTLGQTLLGLVTPKSGRVVLGERDLTTLNAKQWRPLRRDMQIVFQDPYGSLSPRMSVTEILSEGLRIHSPELGEAETLAQVTQALEQVQLPPDVVDRYPHELSGGQRQRIGVARALVLRPKLLVLDEPTSALDLSVQAELLALLKSLQDELGLAYLFVSHDLRVVRSMAHRVLVMKDGKIVEQGDTAQVFYHPKHSYTQRLLSASLNLIDE